MESEVINIGGKTFGADELVGAAIAGEILGGVSKQTLYNWRMLARGPAFYRFGKIIRYSVADLMLYRDQNYKGGKA